MTRLQNCQLRKKCKEENPKHLVENLKILL